MTTQLTNRVEAGPVVDQLDYEDLEPGPLDFTKDLTNQINDIKHLTDSTEDAPNSAENLTNAGVEVPPELTDDMSTSQANDTSRTEPTSNDLHQTLPKPDHERHAVLEERARLQRENAKLKRDNKELCEDIVGMELDVKRFMDENNDLLAERAKLNEDLGRLKGELAEARSQAVAHTTAAEEQRQAVDGLRQAAAQAAGVRARLQGEVEAAAEQATAAKSNADKLRGRIENLGEELQGAKAKAHLQAAEMTVAEGRWAEERDKWSALRKQKASEMQCKVDEIGQLKALLAERPERPVEELDAIAEAKARFEEEKAKWERERKEMASENQRQLSEIEQLEKSLADRPERKIDRMDLYPELLARYEEEKAKWEAEKREFLAEEEELRRDADRVQMDTHAAERARWDEEFRALTADRRRQSAALEWERIRFAEQREKWEAERKEMVQALFVAWGKEEVGEKEVVVDGQRRKMVGYRYKHA